MSNPIQSNEAMTIDWDERRNFAHDLVANLTEATVKESAFDEDSFEKPYNPDDVYKSTGDYSTYESMLKDDQIDSAMQLKKDLVLGSGWMIEHEDDELAEEIKICLTDDQQIPFEDRLEEILSAYEYGFSLTEKIFGKKDGKLYLKALRTRHPNTWLMDQDERGHVTKYIQRGRNGDRLIRPASLLHYVNQPKFQNPFGHSDLRSAHTAWRIKVEILKFWAIFLEKSASPTPVGKYPANTPKEARDKLYSALKKLQNKTTLVIPDSLEVEFLEATQNGEPYERAINLLNTHIGRALMIPDLLGYSGSETQGGSFALGENQMNVFFMHIDRRRRTLEKMIDHHIIKPLCVFNFGMMDSYPKFKFKPIKQEDTEQMAKLWIEAVKGRFYAPTEEEINHFRELVRFPTGEVEHIEYQQPGQMPGAEAEKAEAGEEEEAESVENKTAAAAEDITEGEEASEAEGRQDFTYKQTDSEFSKRVDFRAIKSQMEASEAGIMNEARPLIDDMMARLSDRINKKRIIQDNQIDRLNDLKLERKRDLNVLLTKHLKNTYLAAKQGASAELFRQNFARVDIEDEFLEFLEREITFYIGDVEAATLRSVRQEAIAAIRDGLPFSAVDQFIREELTKQDLISVERWARTKTTEVFNRGRLAFFDESKVVQGYQYSAILDGRTTVICAGLHGKRFKKGTEPVPPMHFNCRSLLIPITMFEDFKADTTAGGESVPTRRGDPISTGKKRNIDQFIDEEIGKGFSRR